MNELTKIFKHLSRDLFVYFLTGFTIFINILLLDYLFNGSEFIIYVRKIPYWGIGISILSYIIGHIIFSISYLLFEYSGIDECLKKKMYPITNNKAFEIDFIKEMNVFNNKVDLHDQFIERHTQLFLMRWNLACGLIICGLTNLIIELFNHFIKELNLLSIMFILTGITLYILSIKTEKDCFDRLNKINEAINNG